MLKNLKQLKDSPINLRDHSYRSELYSGDLTGEFIKARKSFENILDKINTSYVVLVIKITNLTEINLKYTDEIGDKYMQSTLNDLVLPFLQGHLKAKDAATLATPPIYRDGSKIFLALPNIRTVAMYKQCIANLINDFDKHPFKHNESDIVINHKPQIGAFFNQEPGEIRAAESLRRAKLAIQHLVVKLYNDTVRFSIYSKDLEERLAQEEEFRESLLSAVDNIHINNEFFLLYQAQVERTSHKIVGLESLIRWQSAKYNKAIGPDEFIPVLEKAGYVSKLTSWIMQEAFRQAAAWQKINNEVRLSINISRYQRLNENIVNEIAQIIEETEVDPTRITLEITEEGKDLLTTESEQVMQAIHERFGITFAIDDFGAPYSTIDVLKFFNNKPYLTEIKTDMSLTSHPNILNALISTFQAMGKRVVVEGIENSKMLQEITREDIIIQGYINGNKPQRSADITKKITAFFKD